MITFENKLAVFLSRNDLLLPTDFIRELCEFEASNWHEIQYYDKNLIGKPYQKYMDSHNLTVPNHEIIRIVK